jgi:hypothetical protein
VEAAFHDKEDTENLDKIAGRGRKRGFMAPAERFRRAEVNEAKRIRRFLATFDGDGAEVSLSTAATEQVIVDILTGDNLEDVSLLAEEARVGPGVFVESDGEVDLVDVEAAEVEADLHLRAVSGADCTAAEAAAEVSLKTGARVDVAVTITEDVSGLTDLRIEIDSVANPEATSDTRFKKVRKAEAMGTAAAEPLAVPEKKRRVDGVFSVESEAETNAGFVGLGSGEMKSRAFRSDEARAKRNAKDNQRQRKRKASISSSQIMTETDSAQEAKETEGTGKWKNSSEHLHGLN